jgi:hypothetical protein
MIRRPQLTQDAPQERGNDYRKKRTYMSAPRGTHSSIMRAAAYKPDSGAELDSRMSKWIGKRIIYIGQESTIGFYETNYVKEEDIAYTALPNSYRIIYVNDPKNGPKNDLMFYDDPLIQKSLMARSLLTVDYRPARMNILVDTSNIIRDVRFF